MPRKSGNDVPNARLREAREACRWSQRDVADRIGTTPNNVSRWELGQTTPGPYFRARLCVLFGKSIEELGLVEQAPPLPMTGQAAEEPVLTQHEALSRDQDEGWQTAVQEWGRLVVERFISKRTDTPADRDWGQMLRRLRRSYKELLDQSLHGLAWIDLDLSEQPELVSNVTNLLFRLPQGGERLLSPGTKILDAYDETGGELLILGAPGAGKSTLLVDLAQQLVDRALSGESPWLPVILRLSSWAIHRPVLADWMTEQLSQTYDVPRKLSERWVKEGRLLPLLDGLDEVEAAARPACITAINDYHRTHLAPLVICSRHAEYEIAVQRDHLALQSAVIVQPLTDERIEGYLDAAGSSFAGIRTALHEHRALWELATTPLMLSVLLLAYRGVSPEEITHRGTDLEQQVWTDYVTRQVQEKGNISRYPLKRTCTWLAFLAQQLRTHQQTTFYAEHLSLNWLSKTQQGIVTWLTMLIPSMVIGVCASILTSIFTVFYTDVIFLLEMGVFGSFVGVCLSSFVTEKPTESRGRPLARVIRRFRNAVLLGIFIAAGLSLRLNPLFFQVREWLQEGSILGLGSVLSGWAFQMLLNPLPKQREGSILHKHLDPRGRFVTWVNIVVPSYLWQAMATLGIGIGLSYGLGVGLRYGLRAGLSYGLGAGLKDGMSVGVTVVLVHLIFSVSFKTPRFVERIRWTWRSLCRAEHLRTAGIVTTTAFLFYGLSYGLSYGLGNGLRFGPSDGLNAGLYNGLNYGLGYGLSLGLMYWLLLGFYQGMTQEHLEDHSRFQFNQGIRRSLLYGFLTSLISATIITMMGEFSYGLSAALSYGLGSGLSDGFSYGLSDGFSYGLSTALSYGLSYEPGFGLGSGLIMLIAGMVVIWPLCGGLTVLRHYIIRASLARTRTFPFRAQAFLEDATSRILLRRVGGGYSFIHRRLQDYFADVVSPNTEARGPVKEGLDQSS